MPYTIHINTKQVMHWIQFQSYQQPINLDLIAEFSMESNPGFPRHNEENVPCISFTISSGRHLNWEYDDESTRNEDYQKLIEMILPIRSN